MKSYKELREYMRGFGIGPSSTLKPQNSLGGAQFFPNKRYDVTMPQLTATAKGPGLGTIKPMVTASKKKEKK
jgi:hypothetical protein|tara:strand:- start:403 stop:618 length:216 start_codon:yes stop_codon:yes gene_type:complete